MSGNQWTAELLRLRRRRARFMGFAILALVVLFYAVTYQRLMDNVAKHNSQAETSTEAPAMGDADEGAAAHE